MRWRTRSRRAAPRVAKADLVPTEANLLDEYTSVGELDAACERLCTEVNGSPTAAPRLAPSTAQPVPGGSSSSPPAPAAYGAPDPGRRCAARTVPHDAMPRRRPEPASAGCAPIRPRPPPARPATPARWGSKAAWSTGAPGLSAGRRSTVGRVWPCPTGLDPRSPSSIRKLYAATSARLAVGGSMPSRSHISRNSAKPRAYASIVRGARPRSTHTRSHATARSCRPRTGHFWRLARAGLSPTGRSALCRAHTHGSRSDRVRDRHERCRGPVFMTGSRDDRGKRAG